MHVFLAVAVAGVVYVIAFKDEFEKEHLDKAAPFVFGLAAVALILGILSNL